MTVPPGTPTDCGFWEAVGLSTAHLGYPQFPAYPPWEGGGEGKGVGRVPGGFGPGFRFFHIACVSART